MVLGVVHSPELELLSLFVSVGIFVEIGRLEEKVSSLEGVILAQDLRKSYLNNFGSYYYYYQRRRKWERHGLK